MSTGLTWIVFTEATSGPSPSVENSLVFNDYNEAQDFCDWYIRIYLSAVTSPTFYIMVYTTSPNSSGYWSTSGGPLFTVFD